jgi:hypothetical protein
MLDTTGEPGGSLCAFLKIGAGTLAHKHFTLALASECSKIICISRGLTPELVSLQHEVERAGVRFHCVPGARALAALITAIDEVVVISDGLLAPHREAHDLLSQGQGVAVQPVEIGLAAGFERIDAKYAAAGLMRVPGRLFEQLSMLPDDCDVPSALTRIALQAGIAQRQLPVAAGAAARVRILRNQAEADTVEAEWFDLQLRGGTLVSQGPAMWVAHQVVRLTGPSMLHGRNGSNTFALGCLAICLLALVAGWFGLVTVALVGGGIASIAALGCGILRQVEQESLSLVSDRWHFPAGLRWLIDASLFAVLTWNLPGYAGEAAWHRAFAPLMLLVVIRLVSPMFQSSWAAWLGDRLIFCLILAVSVAAGWLAFTISALAVCVGLFGLLWSKGRLRLTSV